MISYADKLEETAKEIYEFVRKEINHGKKGKQKISYPWDTVTNEIRERWLMVAQWHLETVENNG